LWGKNKAISREFRKKDRATSSNFMGLAEKAWCSPGRRGASPSPKKLEQIRNRAPLRKKSSKKTTHQNWNRKRFGFIGSPPEEKEGQGKKKRRLTSKALKGVNENEGTNLRKRRGKEKVEKQGE